MYFLPINQGTKTNANTIPKKVCNNTLSNFIKYN